MSIKLNRALKMVKLLPMAEREILKKITPEIIAGNTSKTLASIIKALNQHWYDARAFEVNNIVNEGCFWHPKKEKLFQFD